jgi:hypothetical protein
MIIGKNQAPYGHVMITMVLLTPSLLDPKVIV